ncbi:hypothetical protein [Endozoicomonas sp. SESOKO1]|uniref:hypothetical protein n=1 Tax=Endozoicomonas sp. SESOKO1 TaxID=2828742 RepID=UPI0021480DB7|nr:hypothetical protein [Endozoicomonas sp. SESOKO1]
MPISPSNIITLDVSLVKLIADPELTQVRVRGSGEHRDALLSELQILMEDNPEARLDPIKVVRATDKTSDFHSEVYYLVDGFHRFHAYKAAGVNDYPAEVVAEGDEREARQQALSANCDHALMLALNAADRKKILAMAAEILTEGLPKHKRQVTYKQLVEVTKMPEKFKSSVKRFVTAFNTEGDKAQTALIEELLKVGELTQREIAEEAGTSLATVERKAATLKNAKCVNEGQPQPYIEQLSAETDEDPLAEIASDFAFDPESFMSEVDALADEEFEPNFLPNDEDKYFEVKPLVNVEVETKKAYKTGDDRYSFKKEADQMVAAFPPEVQAGASFASINRAFQDWSQQDAVLCFREMQLNLPDQLTASLKNLRKMLSALEEAGISLP